MTTHLTIHAIAAFEDNYFWLIERTPYAVVVDPGAATPVVAELARRQLQLTAIVLTHHHGDHIGGVAELVARHPGLTVYGPDNPTIPWITQPLREGDQIQLPGLELALDVLEVPGHTLDHIAYYGTYYSSAGQQPVIFCGDTLFSCGCGRLFEGTPEQMLHSLNKLLALPATSKLYCAHEYTLHNIAFALTVDPDNPALQAWAQQAQRLRATDQPTIPTTLAHERATNPFLRTDHPSVRQAAERAQAGSSASAVETFTTLRMLRNRF